MSNPKNPYICLNLDASASLSHESLKEAYRKALLLAHPDKGGSGSIEDIKNAYKLLSNNVDKVLFDKSLASQKVRLQKLADQRIIEEDLNIDGDGNVIWSLCNRCGGKFIFQQEDLEMAEGVAVRIECSNCNSVADFDLSEK